jgi:hypothetical protein
MSFLESSRSRQEHIPVTFCVERETSATAAYVGKMPKREKELYSGG